MCTEKRHDIHNKMWQIQKMWPQNKNRSWIYWNQYQPKINPLQQRQHQNILLFLFRVLLSFPRETTLCKSCQWPIKQKWSSGKVHNKCGCSLFMSFGKTAVLVGESGLGGCVLFLSLTPQMRHVANWVNKNAAKLSSLAAITTFQFRKSL